MKKIPSLFERVYENHKVVDIKNQLVKPELQVVLDGKCIPTLKIDGACCSYLDGVFYRRYDAKHGKKPPKGAIPCCEPDPVTGHHPHWLPVNEQEKSDKWFIVAKENYIKEHGNLEEGTYEAIGVHFQNNPYNLDKDTLYKHGCDILDISDFSFEGLKKYLSEHYIEGIVFWYNGEPLCKLKRSDFGFPWKT